MIDKLLTLREAADELGLSSNEVRRLVDEGAIPAYQIGGMYLRFKEEHVLSLKGRYKASSNKHSVSSEDNPAQEEQRFSRVIDFFYFNDFYILSAVLVCALLYIIVRSIM